MQITELKKEGLDFHIKVTIPVVKVDTKIQNQLTDLAKQVKISGFRVGKVPMSIVNKRYRDSVRSDVLQHEISHVVSDTIKANNLKIAGDPKIEDLKFEDNSDLEFVLKFELLPKIDLPDFNAISIEKPVLKVSKDEINQRLELFVDSKLEYSEAKKGKAAIKDQIVIDAIGYVDGKPFDNGKLENYKLVLGSKSFIDTFEDQLVGSKIGQEITVKVTFPQDYFAEDLAGKPAEFAVTVKEIYSPTKPELSDEFAKRFQCENLAELTQKAEKSIIDDFSDDILTLMKMSLFDKLEEVLQFEVPNSIVEKEIELLKPQFAKEEEISNKPKDEQNEYYKKLALRRVRIGLLIPEYAKVNNIKVSQNDIRDAVYSFAKQFPGKEAEVIKIYQGNRDLLKSLSNRILETKVIENILDTKVKITEKQYSKKNLEKLLEDTEASS